MAVFLFALLVCNGHLADTPAAPVFVRYWGNSGKWSARTLNGSVANDPSRTLGSRTIVKASGYLRSFSR